MKIQTEKIDITKPYFNFTIKDEVARTLTREEYYKTMSWLRSVRRELRIQMGEIE